MITRLLFCSTLLSVLLAEVVQANTEKVIFLAPSPRALLTSLLNSDTKAATNVLSPEQFTIRTSLPVAFPTTDQPRGLEYWYLLRHLTENQRYEVRVCWSATQPTDFWLNVFELDHLDQVPISLQGSVAALDRPAESLLALRIEAAADFFSSNQTLMQFPPPVDVDIILDPYLLSVFPTSLVPTALYISLLAVIGYVVSGFVWRYLQSEDEPQKLRKD